MAAAAAEAAVATQVKGAPGKGEPGPGPAAITVALGEDFQELREALAHDTRRGLVPGGDASDDERRTTPMPSNPNLGLTLTHAWAWPSL